jgi:2-polyprenyl-6-methoxyphenol hydroxylase-like FAD-dependent oxidoreductase
VKTEEKGGKEGRMEVALADGHLYNNGSEHSNQQIHHNERIIIVGAGPVGLLLALRLAQHKIPSTVLEMGATLNTAARAIGYLGAVYFVFQEAGIFERIARDGMHAAGFAWRKLPEVNEKGDVVLGETLAKMVAPKAGPEGYAIGKYTIQLAQTELSKIMLEECDKTGMVDVLWNHRVEGLTEDAFGVSVTVETPHGTKELRGTYLVGAHGSNPK